MLHRFELTDETLQLAGPGVTLYRIRALIDIPRHGVKAGDIGGWVESTCHLSPEGDAWIGDHACVYGKARVSGHALVSGEARVFGHAHVSGRAFVLGNVRISGSARLSS